MILSVVLTNAGPLLTVLARETEATPIVFVIASHPVEHGEADSVARPGRNLTGFPAFEFSMGSKWLGLLKEIAPSVVRAGTDGSSSRIFSRMASGAASRR